MESDDLDKIVDNIYKTYDAKRVKEAYKILNKLFNNIINNPDEEKYKIFNKGNINLKIKVLLIKECQDILNSLGYVELDNERLIFKGDIKRLKYATYILNKIIFEIDEILEKQQKEEEEKRQEEIRKQFEETNRAFMEQKMERERLRQQCENDRKEVAQKMKPKDSVANKLQFGSKEIKVQFQCSGGGGKR